MNDGSTDVPPLSAAAQRALEAHGNINLDDIFGDCFFTPDGNTVFANDQNPGTIVQSSEVKQSSNASKLNEQTGKLVPVQGSIPTLGETKSGSTLAGVGYQPVTHPTNYGANRPTAQQPHHLPFVATMPGGGSKPSSASIAKKNRPNERKMSEQQKVERRERNREHAKRSRIRKKFLLDSLQHSVSLLKEENDKLRQSIRANLPSAEAEQLLSDQNLTDQTLIAGDPLSANKVLDDPDFRLVKALQTAHQNFIVTDPSLPDNPIVYATQGFLNLTGYTLDQVLGRNCRFLQGPETDPKAVAKIRHAIDKGYDTSVCLLNYRVDGTTFWNQFFIAALRDANGNVTNYVGVQCKVSDEYAANVCKKQDQESKETEARINQAATAAEATQIAQAAAASNNSATNNSITDTTMMNS